MYERYSMHIAYADDEVSVGQDDLPATGSELLAAFHPADAHRLHRGYAAVERDAPSLGGHNVLRGHDERRRLREYVEENVGEHVAPLVRRVALDHLRVVQNHSSEDERVADRLPPRVRRRLCC